MDTQIANLKLSNSGLAENLETVKTVAAQGGDLNAFRWPKWITCCVWPTPS